MINFPLQSFTLPSHQMLITVVINTNYLYYQSNKIVLKTFEEVVIRVLIVKPVYIHVFLEKTIQTVLHVKLKNATDCPDCFYHITCDLTILTGTPPWFCRIYLENGIWRIYMIFKLPNGNWLNQG